jgi:hypothetical protein
VINSAKFFGLKSRCILVQRISDGKFLYSTGRFTAKLENAWPFSEPEYALRVAILSGYNVVEYLDNKII